jgi:hypothetical protein
MFHASQKKMYSESYSTASMSDTIFFNEFYEIRDERNTYKGILKLFKLKKWKYFIVPPEFNEAIQHHMICYHIGDSYTNWNGITNEMDLTPTH